MEFMNICAERTSGKQTTSNAAQSSSRGSELILSSPETKGLCIYVVTNAAFDHPAETENNEVIGSRALSIRIPAKSNASQTHSCRQLRLMKPLSSKSDFDRHDREYHFSRAAGRTVNRAVG